MAQQDIVHPDALELASLLRPAWAEVSHDIPRWHPRMEGDAAGDAGAAAAGAAAGAAAAAATADDDEGSGDDAADAAAAGAAAGDKTDWKAMARKHEREAKKARAEAEAHKAKLAEIEKSNLTDQEKAIATAREEAKAEAQGEYHKERRADKIEAAVTRIAASTGVTIGEGDKAKTVKFADPDDVLMWLERQIDKGEIDGDELYANGKVDGRALTVALTGLAKSKPGWLVGNPTNGGGLPAGEADAGKGKSGSGVPTMNDLIRGKRSG